MFIFIDKLFASIIVFHSHCRVLAKCGSLILSHVVTIQHDIMERPPSKYWGFLIPEPLGSNTLEVVAIHVGDSGGNFSSGDEPIQVGSLGGISNWFFGGVISLEEFIPVAISCSENFSSLNLSYRKCTLWAYSDILFWERRSICLFHTSFPKRKLP